MAPRICKASVLLVILVSACRGPAVDRYAAQPARLAFVGVGVVYPGRGQVLPDQTVIVEGGRIVSVGRSNAVRLPPSTTIVNGSGQYLMPGLVDAHVHHFEPDRGYFEPEMLLFLAKGVTSVRIMNGTERALRARELIRAGRLVGPRLVVCSPQIARNSDGSSLDSARAAVRRYAARGYDCIKIYTGPKLDAFAAAVAIADSLRIPTAGHAATRLPFDQILRLGSIEHVEELQWFFGRRPLLTSEEDGPRVDSIARSGVPVVTTLGGFDFRRYVSDTGYARIRAMESSRYAPESWMRESDSELTSRRAKGTNIDSLVRSFGEMYARALRYTKFFHDRGVRLIMGTDAGNLLHVPGFAAMLELETLVAAGLTPAEALTSATENGADLLGVDGGRIEPGRVSDVILLRANPLTNVANVAQIEGVMVGTKWLDRRATDAILADLRKWP